VNIVVDAMGGDHAPQAIVAGVVEAINDFDVDITLIGIKDKIEAELAQYDFPKTRMHIIHAPEVVGMHESATVALRKKKDSSITVGVSLLKDDSYDAFVSAGNTGAVVAAATIKLGMLEGVERPAIGLILPTVDNFTFLIDVGANTEPKQIHLLQSALMGRVYAKAILGVDEPKVALLNIGEEASKGGGFAKEVFKLLEGSVKNFIGNIEATEVFDGKADCIVCDGYVGNIVIKVAQGIAESAATLIKREVKKSPLALFGAFIMKNKLNNIKKMADYTEYGGAPLLGVNGLVMISHGRSSPKAFKNAIRATMREVEHKLLETMKTEVTKANVLESKQHE